MRILCAGLVWAICVSLVAAQPPADAAKGAARGRGFVQPREGAPRPATSLPVRGPAGRMVSLEVLIAETETDFDQPTAAKILDREKAGQLFSHARLRLTLLEELPAFAKFNESAPRVTGHSSAGERSRPMPIYQDVNIGTTVQATLRIDDQGDALVQLYVERSRLAKSKEKDEPASTTTQPRRVETLNVQSTVRAKLGEPLLITAGPPSSESSTQGWIVLTIREE